MQGTRHARDDIQYAAAVERRWARISLGAVALLLALTAVSLVTKPTPCGSLPASYPPIIAFELARDGADLAALFGSPGACRDAMVKAMDLANTVDIVAFIPAYALFLFAWFAAMRTRSAAWARAGMAITVIAALGDLVENACLFGLTPELDAGSPWLARLPWATGVKWLALGVAGLCAAAILVRGTRAAKVGAALCLAAPLATVAAMIAPARVGPVLATGVAVSWIACLVAIVPTARRPSSRT